jgi:KUP system potassium uptake protein
MALAGSIVSEFWLGADLMAMQGIAQGRSVERSTGRASRGSSFGIPAGLAIAALGVVFGDIGTSPLYTLKTCFDSANAAPTVENTLGILSLLVWALLFVVCLKYVTVLMRIDHDGEGGILALLALAEPPKIHGAKTKASWLVWVVVIGGAMLIGDGMITPAISVISAVEGIGFATSAAQPFVVPISAGVLIALFGIQWRGTETVGRLFGPVMIVWFTAIALTGLIAIVAHPAILAAFDPRHAAGFAFHHGLVGFLVFGAVVLCVTGAEALYADMSHFGRRPIALAWYGCVLPALLLNYLGQGALVINDPKVLASPFYALTTGPLLLPMVALATAATIIASQSLISGAFTITEQAIALNLSPRLAVLHTSRDQRGQVYVPVINMALGFACLALVLAFRSSDRLAAAYGLAVACTMAATDIAFFVVATRVYKWRKRWVAPLVGLFLTVDGVFILAGLPKFFDGAWIPLAISALVMAIAITWLEGRRGVAKVLAEHQVPVAQFLAQHPALKQTAEGTMVLLTGDPNGVPFVTHHRWLVPRLDRERVALLTIVSAGRPYVDERERVTITRPCDRFAQIAASFGYMERPRIKPIIEACKRNGFDIDNDTTSFVYADPIILRKTNGLPRWQRRLFGFLHRLSKPLAEELRIKPERRVELGVEVDV